MSNNKFYDLRVVCEVYFCTNQQVDTILCVNTTRSDFGYLMMNSKAASDKSRRSVYDLSHQRAWLSQHIPLNANEPDFLFRTRLQSIAPYRLHSEGINWSGIWWPWPPPAFESHSVKVNISFNPAITQEFDSHVVDITILDAILGYSFPPLEGHRVIR